MAELTYRLDTLYREAFPDLAQRQLGRLDGLRDAGLDAVERGLGNGFEVGDGKPARTADILDFKGIGTVAIQDNAKNLLGLPVFQPIYFKGGRLPVLGSGREAGQVVLDDYAGWQLPDTATAEIKRSKAITKSSPNGAASSVKELWAFEDWDITIRGLLLDLKGRPNHFPADQLTMLHRWEQVVDAIAVEGGLFGYLGIRRLVIESMSLGRVAGMPNVIPFQLQCVSDEELEVTLLENQL